MNDAHQSSATITLSAHQVHAIFTALVQAGNLELAVQIMGMMGKQQPTRIIPPTAQPTIKQLPRPATPAPVGTLAQDVLNALNVLGYNQREAKEALANVNLLNSLDDCVREALAYISPQETSS